MNTEKPVVVVAVAGLCLFIAVALGAGAYFGYIAWREAPFKTQWNDRYSEPRPTP